MSNRGFIYILSNPSLDGLVKIGKTTRTPLDRVTELSSATGIPTPFQLLYFKEFEDCDAAERALHALFTARDARVADNREFFRAAPHEAITAVMNLSISNLQVPSSGNSLSLDAESTSLAGELVADAKAYLIGTGGKYRDVAKAVSIFRNAVDLGSAEACSWLGTIYGNHEEVFDLQKARSILQKGAELGSIACNAELAATFIELNEKDNAERAWLRFFSNANQLSPFDRGYYALQCVEHIAKRGLSRELIEIARPFTEDMLQYIQDADRQGLPERHGTTRQTRLDLLAYMLLGTEPPNSLTGRIKWFNSAKGYGFIIGNDGRDYFLHSSSILSDSGSPEEGRPVRFQSVSLEQGLAADNVFIQ